MKIDYFCFSVPNLTSNDYVINEKDNENTVWIKSKEKKLMDAAKEANLLILFDRRTKKFYLNYEEVDIKGKVIFPRSFILYEKELLFYLEQNGAESIQTLNDLEKITNWPLKIQPLHRRVIETSYKEFQQNDEKYKANFENIFFKTAKKSNVHFVLKFFGNIDIGGNKYFATKPLILNVSLEDDIFLSDVFESIEDKENKIDCKEYRAFILNNALLSISRSYVDYPTDVPTEIKLFVEDQISRASLISDFPCSYVLDVGEVLIDGRKVIDIIEYNSICSSGLEVCNLLVDELLEQKQSLNKIIKNKKKVIYE